VSDKAENSDQPEERDARSDELDRAGMVNTPQLAAWDI